MKSNRKMCKISSSSVFPCFTCDGKSNAKCNTCNNTGRITGVHPMVHLVDSILNSCVISRKVQCANTSFESSNPLQKFQESSIVSRNPSSQFERQVLTNSATFVNSTTISQQHKLLRRSETGVYNQQPSNNQELNQIGQEEEEQEHCQYQCDQCKSQPIFGKRYHCEQCKDFDLCGRCNKKSTHCHKLTLVQVIEKQQRIIQIIQYLTNKNKEK